MLKKRRLLILASLLVFVVLCILNNFFVKDTLDFWSLQFISTIILTCLELAVLALINPRGRSRLRLFFLNASIAISMISLARILIRYLAHHFN